MVISSHTKIEILHVYLLTIILLASLSGGGLLLYGDPSFHPIEGRYLRHTYR